MCHKIADDAIFIADAHYGSYRENLLKLLYDIDSGSVATTQLFLMGDIADLLFGGVDATYELNRDFIALLESIGSKIELVYLEGNHDFNLSKIFKNLTIYPRESQPVIYRYREHNIALAHGDLYGSRGYEIYTKLIRNRAILKFLNTINNIFGNFIINNLLSSMQRKKHCQKIEHFRDLIEKKLEFYDIKNIDILIEGHYHQGESFSVCGIEYINLDAFACNESYFRVQLLLDKQKET